MSNGTLREAKAIDRIQKSIYYPYVHALKTDIRMSNGEIICPDIAIWHKEPAEENDAIITLPVAVIDVDSRENYGDPKLYLQAGIADYVVFNPLTNEARRYMDEEVYEIYQSPKMMEFKCGCKVIV